MHKPKLSSTTTRKTLREEGFLAMRESMSNEVKALFTVHDTHIGFENENADLTVNGGLYVGDGAKGILHLPDGRETLRAGENVVIGYNEDGTVSISTQAGQDISYILSTVQGFDSRISKNASDILQIQSHQDVIDAGQAALQERVTATESGLATVTRGLGAVNGVILSLERRVMANEGDISNILLADSTRDARITTLEGALNTERNSRIAADTEITHRLDALGGLLSAETSQRVSQYNELSGSFAGAIYTVNNSILALSSSMFLSFTSIDSNLLALSSSIASDINYLRTHGGGGTCSTGSDTVYRRHETNKPKLTSTTTRRELRQEGFHMMRDSKSKDIRALFTVHDTYIGTDNDFADLVVNGAMFVSSGAKGVLHLPSGEKTLRAGENVTIDYGCDGAVTISAKAGQDISSILSTVSDLQAGKVITDAAIATLQGNVGSVVGVVSNLERRVSVAEATIGSNAIDTSARILALSSSISLTDSNLLSLSSSVASDINYLRTHSGGTGVTTVGQFAFNESPVGVIDGVNREFELANTPSPPSSLMLFLNGQLLRRGDTADYVLNGKIITFVEGISPVDDDTILATYQYTVNSKSYSFNESVSLVMTGPIMQGILEFVPDPPNSLMLFYNGQLLTAGQSKDYALDGKTIDFSGIAYNDDDVCLATYSHY
jgi:uncharacterized protein YuzE